MCDLYFAGPIDKTSVTGFARGTCIMKLLSYDKLNAHFCYLRERKLYHPANYSRLISKTIACDNISDELKLGLLKQFSCDGASDQSSKTGTHVAFHAKGRQSEISSKIALIFGPVT